MGDWYLLGVLLDIPAHKLDDIKAEYPRQAGRCTEMLSWYRWLKNDVNASWIKLLKALEDMKEYGVVADKIRQQYTRPAGGTYMYVS